MRSGLPYDHTAPSSREKVGSRVEPEATLTMGRTKVQLYIPAISGRNQAVLDLLAGGDRAI